MEESKELVALKSKWFGQALVEELTRPTPDDGTIRTRRGRGRGMVEYVEGASFIEKLNACFGFLWSYEVPQIIREGDQIVSKGKLTVHIPIPKKKVVRRFVEDGRQIEEESTEFEILDIVKEQSGSSEVKRYARTEYATDKRGNRIQDAKGQPIIKHKAGDVIDLGDDYKAAGTDAMKKAATQFGIFLDVYKKRGEEEEEPGAVGKKQLETFYWRAENAGMDETKANEWIKEKLGKPLEECDLLDIMGLIPALIDLAEAKEKAVGG